jgi:hypothetical protein
MELQQRLSEFVSAHNAPRFTNVKGLSFGNQDTLFGLSGIKNPDAGTLTVTLGQVPNQLDLAGCSACVLGLYKYVDGMSDYLVREISVDLDFLVMKPVPHISVVLRIDDLDDLFVTCMLTNAQGQYGAWCSVESDASFGKLLVYKERYRTSLDVLPEKPPSDFVLVENPATDFGFSLNFSKNQFSDTGTLGYTGGGNRLLPSIDGGFGVQVVDEPTWDFSGEHAFVEPTAKNYISDTRLEHQTAFQTNALHNLITTHKQVASAQFPDYWFWMFAGNGSSELNNTWEISIPSVPVDSDIVTGSAFLEFETNRQLRVRVGVRETTVLGVFVQDRYAEYKTTKIDMNM